LFPKQERFTLPIQEMSHGGSVFAIKKDHTEFFEATVFPFEETSNKTTPEIEKVFGEAKHVNFLEKTMVQVPKVV
jgi:hypothetical protein